MGGDPSGCARGWVWRNADRENPFSRLAPEPGHSVGSASSGAHVSQLRSQTVGPPPRPLLRSIPAADVASAPQGNPADRPSTDNRVRQRGGPVATPTIPSVERSAIRKVSLRLVPFVALMFFINYLDRTAIGFAAPNGMNDDLALTVTQVGFASACSLHRLHPARSADQPGAAPVRRAPVARADHGQLGTRRPALHLGRHLRPARHPALRARRRRGRILPRRDPVPQPVGARAVPRQDRRALLPGAALHHRDRRAARRMADQPDGLFGLEGWRFMYLGVALPAIIIGVVAWFYLKDKPSDAKWLTNDEQVWLTDEIAAAEDPDRRESAPGNVGAALTSGRVWVISGIYFGFIYGLYALAFFLPTIISGFEAQFGTKFSVFEKGLITGIPYLPAALVLYLWTRDATRRGVRTWHIALPAAVGGLTSRSPCTWARPPPRSQSSRSRPADLRGAAHLLDRPHAVPHGCRSRCRHRPYQHDGQRRRVRGRLRHRMAQGLLGLVRPADVRRRWPHDPLRSPHDRAEPADSWRGPCPSRPRSWSPPATESTPRPEPSEPLPQQQSSLRDRTARRPPLMTRLANNPAEFAHEALEGFVAAHRRWVRQVPGGVVRTSPKVPGHVAVVVGGGCGPLPRLRRPGRPRSGRRRGRR